MSQSRTFQIKNKLGMHARAATAFVQTANRFDCEVVIRKDGLEVNGKSIMGVLQLAAAKGQQIEVVADGAESEAALGAIGTLIADLFGEDD